MKTRTITLLAALWIVAPVCGCVPPEEEDEVQKTLRMYEEAKGRSVAGKGRNVYVSVERISVARERAAGLASLWRYTSGRLTVSGSNGLARGGVRAGLAGGGFGAKVAAFAAREKNVRRTTAEIMVLSGEEGYLWVGRDVSVPLLRIVSGSGEGSVEIIERARVGASLRVRPRVLGDGRVELALTPSFSVLSGPRRGSRILADVLSTRVVVRPGEKVVLGSSSTARADSAAAGLFGYDTSGAKTATVVVLKVDRL
ncbi:MAG: hypothetical protein ACYTGB_05095 [Planctomycetota bacterium]|jgi:Flp pilus assembly secretin CpaC